MFYTRRKKFSVYKDYFPKDILLSDASFQDDDAAERLNQHQAKKPSDSEIQDMFSLGNITTAAEIGDSSGVELSVSNIRIKPRVEKAQRPRSKNILPKKVTKTAKGKPISDKPIPVQENKQRKEKKRDKKQKLPLKPRPTVFVTLGNKPRVEKSSPANIEKQRLAPPIREHVYPAINDKSFGFDLNEFENIPYDFHIDGSPENTSAYDTGDVPFIVSRSPSPSMQLSQFVQPPRSTSTPFDSKTHGYNRARPTTRRPNSPLDKQPLGYSTPLFRFVPDDIESNDSSFIGSYNTKDDVPLPRVVSYESPLARKLYNESFTSNIHSITDKLKNSVSLKDPEDNYGDLPMTNISVSAEECDEKMITSLENSTSESQHTLFPNKSILKISSSFNTKPKKVVRINDDALKDTAVLPRLKKTQKKRSANEDFQYFDSMKKAKLSSRSDSGTTYQELLALCGNEKDPLDLIMR